MTDSPTLFDATTARRRGQEQAEASEAEGRDVIRTLRQFTATGKRWVLAREIIAALGWPDCENLRRRLRSIAENNDKLIISGDKGYALLAACAPDEIQHAANRLESQGRKMLARSIAIKTAYHQFGRAA